MPNHSRSVFSSTSHSTSLVSGHMAEPSQVSPTSDDLDVLYQQELHGHYTKLAAEVEAFHPQFSWVWQFSSSSWVSHALK